MVTTENLPRIITKDEGESVFHVSVLVNYEVFPLKNIYEKKLTINFRNCEIEISLKKHNVEYVHKNSHDDYSGEHPINLRLIEFLLKIPLDYDLFIEYYERLPGSMPIEDLERSRNYTQHAVTQVLKQRSIEILNSFLDYYRIYSLSVPVNPITKNSILHFSYIKYSDKIRFQTEDRPEDSELFPTSSEDHWADAFQNILNQPNLLNILNLNIINAFRMYETGHYPQCVSGIIDCFHSFLDYIFEVNITNESLKKELSDNPAEYNAKDKTTWLFEMVAGKTLKQFLNDNQNLSYTKCTGAFLRQCLNSEINYTTSRDLIEGKH
jgi:hypothetical protein